MPCHVSCRWKHYRSYWDHPPEALPALHTAITGCGLLTAYLCTPTPFALPAAASRFRTLPALPASRQQPCRCIRACCITVILLPHTPIQCSPPAYAGLFLRSDSQFAQFRCQRFWLPHAACDCSVVWHEHCLLHRYLTLPYPSRTAYPATFAVARWDLRTLVRIACRNLDLGSACRLPSLTACCFVQLTFSHYR